jgi:hypothetical protein
MRKVIGYWLLVIGVLGPLFPCPAQEAGVESKVIPAGHIPVSVRPGLFGDSGVAVEDIAADLATKLGTDAVVQTTGTNTTEVMSQAAVTDSLDLKQNLQKTIAIIHDGEWSWYDGEITNLVNNIDTGDTAIIYPGFYEWAGVKMADLVGEITSKQNITILGVGRPVIYSDFGTNTQARAIFKLAGCHNSTIKGIDFVLQTTTVTNNMNYGLTISDSTNCILDDCGFYLKTETKWYASSSAKALVGVNSYGARVNNCTLGIFASGDALTSEEDGITHTAFHSVDTNAVDASVFTGCKFISQPSWPLSIALPYLSIRDCKANFWRRGTSGSALYYAGETINYEEALNSVPDVLKTLVDSQYYAVDFGYEIEESLKQTAYIHQNFGSIGSIADQAGNNAGYWEGYMDSNTNVFRVLSLAGRVAYDAGGAYRTVYGNGKDRFTVTGQWPSRVRTISYGIPFLGFTNAEVRVENMIIEQANTSGNLFLTALISCSGTTLTVDNCDLIFRGNNGISAPLADVTPTGSNNLFIKNSRIALGGTNTFYTGYVVRYLNVGVWTNETFTGPPAFVLDGSGQQTWTWSATSPTGPLVKRSDFHYNTASNMPSWYNGTNWVFR